MQAGVSPAKEDEEQKQKQKEDPPAAISSPGAPVDRKSPERGDSQRLVTRQGREQTEYEAKLRKMHAEGTRTEAKKLAERDMPAASGGGLLLH